jgi:hypothetical protein
MTSVSHQLCVAKEQQMQDTAYIRLGHLNVLFNPLSASYSCGGRKGGMLYVWADPPSQPIYLTSIHQKTLFLLQVTSD